MNARHLLFYITLGGMTAFCGARAVVAGIRGRMQGVERMQRLWGRSLLAAAAVEMQVEGADHVRAGQPYVIISNHASALDPLLLFAGIPFGFTYVAKRELLRVPIFGWIIGRTGAVFIDRGNSGSAHATLQQAAERMRQGQSVLVFPEGTRSRDGRLKPFKKGGFVLALDAGVDILPVSLVGASDLCPRGDWFPKRGRAIVRIHPPVPTRGYRYEDRDALMVEVRRAIASGLGQEQGHSEARTEAA